MVGAELPEKVDHALTFQLTYKVLPEARFQFLDFEKPIPILVLALDCTPDEVPVARIFVDQSCEPLHRHLLKALQFLV